jgi:alpha-glucosidase (family GH31 glycosyl hydrolase)
MKRLSVFLLLLIGTIQGIYAQSSGQPVADPKAIVREGSARFTVLTPRTIRMEWRNDQKFTDDASFVVINRKLPVPEYSVKRKDGWLYITTGELELRYQMVSGKFSDKNLSIKSLSASKAFNWAPGAAQKGNLKGTYRTLDGFDGDMSVYSNTKMELEDGLIATDGWSLIDDSKGLLFDNSDWQWVKQRLPGDQLDWYFMGYGKQFKKALYDYSQIAGKIPMPPRYAFGYWWSRYWSYNENEVRDVVNNFQKFNIPLDVFVIDMDWHYTDSLRSKRKDETDQPQHWTGWTWNKRLFSEPDAFLKWMKTKNLKTTLNLHPASGIAPYEAPYSAFAKRMNFDTTGKKNIPFQGSDKKFMTSLFDVVLHPMEKAGVSFWWLDWQQWGNDTKIPELSNTWWLNYIFFTDQERNSDKRALLYHRWGGLGNHRYQIGFSGDAVISWKSLAFQPYFTSSASNVLYGYWSHDIGGHQFGPGEKILDPELYVRWMQFGSLSPIFRSHSTKDSRLNKEVWNFRGEFFDALSNSIAFRYQLTPYIYTMARKTYDTAISLCRPLYYDYPNDEQAYSRTSQYMFGDDMLIAPIGTAMKDGETSVTVWLPKGNNWYEWQTGSMLKGGQEIDRKFTIEEYPIYVKAGSVIPMYPSVKNLDKAPGQTIVGVFPGADGTGEIYEDAGNNKDYAKAYAFTKVVSKYLPNRVQQITIMPRKGQYAGMPKTRTYILKLYGAEMPQEIVVNGTKLAYSYEPDSKNWSYDGKTLSVNIPLPEALCSTEQRVDVRYSKSDRVDVNTGLVKRFRQLSKTVTALKFKSPGMILPESVGVCEETNLRLQYHPQNFYQNIRYFQQNFEKLPEALKERASDTDIEWFKKSLK